MRTGKVPSHQSSFAVPWDGPAARLRREDLSNIPDEVARSLNETD